MRKSGLALLRRPCIRPKHSSPQWRSFTSSHHIRESQEPFLKSKVAGAEGDIPEEQWFPTLASPPPARYIPSQNSEESSKGPQNEEDVNSAQLTRDASPNPVVKDASTQLFSSDGTVTIDPMYLRDSCRCPLCIEPSTQQRNFNTAHIPPDISAVFAGRSNHGRVKVRWNNDIPGFSPSHESIFSQSQLRSITSPSPNSWVARKRHYWDQATFSQRGNWTSYTDFINNPTSYKAALSALNRDGLIFLTSVPSDESAIESVAARLGPLRNTFYGPTWNVRSMPNSKNIAYTSAHLGFHMDLLYTANPPGYQLLHVLKNSCQGGESRFADSFYAAGRLKREDVRVYRRLCRWPVEWQYENDGQYYVQHRHTFEEVSHFVGANEAARRRIDRKQKQSALGDSDTAGEGRDADADLAYVNYSPPFQGRLVGHKPQHPERTSQFIQAIRRFDRILNSEDMVFELKMEEGTCAVFENRRVVHARNAFSVQEGDGGERWLKGAYVDEEAFWSTMVREGVEMEPDMEGVPEVKEGVVRTYGAPARPPAKWRRVWFDSKESG